MKVVALICLTLLLSVASLEFPNPPIRKCPFTSNPDLNIGTTSSYIVLNNNEQTKAMIVSEHLIVDQGYFTVPCIDQRQKEFYTELSKLQGIVIEHPPNKSCFNLKFHPASFKNCKIDLLTGQKIIEFTVLVAKFSIKFSGLYKDEIVKALTDGCNEYTQLFDGFILYQEQKEKLTKKLPQLKTLQDTTRQSVTAQINMWEGASENQKKEIVKKLSLICDEYIQLLVTMGWDKIIEKNLTPYYQIQGYKAILQLALKYGYDSKSLGVQWLRAFNTGKNYLDIPEEYLDDLAGLDYSVLMNECRIFYQ